MFFCLAVAAVSLFAGCSKPATDPKPVTDAFISVSTRTKVVENVGESVVFDIETNVLDLVCSTDDPAFKCVKSSDTEAVFSLSRANYEAERKVTFSFTSKLNPEADCTKSVTLRSSLLLDVEFNPDGTAGNAVNSSALTSFPGAALFTYRNESAGRYVANFSSKLGSKITEGFYKFDYASSSSFIKGLEDGFSMEVQFMMAGANDAGGEVKVVSSMNSGGFGIMLPADTKDITFLPNISATGSSSWTFTRSGMVPEPGKYYHVIGVWDKAGGECRIYVNGELKGTQKKQGSLVLPSAANQKWICIGGDPAGASTAEAAWRGEIVLARIYNNVLQKDDIADLWKKADKTFKTAITIDGLAYLPTCTVSAGSPFTIAGAGFKEGDAIRFVSSDGTGTDCPATLLKDKIKVTVPAGITSGTYKMYLIRGSEDSILGSVALTVTDNAPEIKRPMIIAHRGFHSASVPENSIAALSAAQREGFEGSETDCWITTDGEIYINHDGKIGGVTIQTSTSAQVAAVKLANGEKIPTFTEYLTQAKKDTGTELVIEIKEHSSSKQNFDCTDKVMKIVKDMQMEDHVQYISFNLDVCKRIAAADPDAMVGFLSAHDLNDLRRNGIMCADFPDQSISANPIIISDAHALGMIVNVWTVNSEFDMMKFIGMGVDAITTDYPDKLKTICDKLL